MFEDIAIRMPHLLIGFSGGCGDLKGCEHGMETVLTEVLTLFGVC